MLISHSSTVSPGDAAIRVGFCPLPSALSPCCAIRIGPASLSAATPIAPSQRVPIQQPAEEIERRRQWRQSKTASRTFAIDELDVEVRLQQDAVLGANLPQEREGLFVASKQHMLAVVDPLACLGITEGRGAAAQHRLGLEHQHPRAASGELDGGPQSGDAGADHDDVGRGHRRHFSGTMTFIHVVAAIIGLPWARDA